MTKDITLTDEPILADAKLLPLFDKARNGCLNSQLDLLIAFSNGDGAKKNNAITSEVEALIFNIQRTLNTSRLLFGTLLLGWLKEVTMMKCLPNLVD